MEFQHGCYFRSPRGRTLVFPARAGCRWIPGVHWNINQQNNLKDAHNFRPNGKIKTKRNLNSQAQINKNKRATVDTPARFWSDKISVSHRGRSGFVVGALLFPCVSFLSHTMRGPCVCVYIDWEWNALCAPLHLILYIFCPDSHRMHPARSSCCPLAGLLCMFYSLIKDLFYLILWVCFSMRWLPPPALRNACMHSHSALGGIIIEYFLIAAGARARPGCWCALFVRARSRFFLSPKGSCAPTDRERENICRVIRRVRSQHLASCRRDI